jgi:FRG domain
MFEDAYRSYRRIRARGDDYKPVGPIDGLPRGLKEQGKIQRQRLEDESQTFNFICLILSDQMTNEGVEKAIRQLQEAFDIEVPAELKEEAIEVEQAILKAKAAPQPLEDVYEVALVIVKNEGSWKEAPDLRVFRGQRDATWNSDASIFRFNPGEEELRMRETRLAAFVDALRERHTHLNEEQLIALAQHYGGREEADVQTWHLDVTTDPFVALFFASLGAVGGTLGKIVSYGIKRWQRLKTGGAGHLGGGPK